MACRKPNVLYVFSDQQRASAIGCADGDEDLLTPNLDSFASEGLRMEAAVSNSPVCTPYRVMLMTGLYGHHTGVTTNNCYPDLSRHPHIGRTFGDAGYRCGYIGKWHTGEEMRLDAGHPMRFRGHGADVVGARHGRHVGAHGELGVGDRGAAGLGLHGDHAVVDELLIGGFALHLGRLSLGRGYRHRKQAQRGGDNHQK